MKVRAKAVGQYNGRTYERGDVFEIEDKEHPIYKHDPVHGGIVKDESGKSVIEGHRPALAHWMEELDEKGEKSPASHKSAEAHSEKKSSIWSKSKGDKE